MSGFHDFLINSSIEDLSGWSREAPEMDIVVLEASDWGELKRKIDQSRKDADILVFRGDKEVNPRACEDPRLDIVIATGEDERISQATAKAASENEVAIAFDFSKLNNGRVKKMKAWKRDLRILEKHYTDYIVTTNAESQEDIRAPRDIAALIDELGGDGEKAVRETPQKILDAFKKRDSDSYLSKGVEKV